MDPDPLLQDLARILRSVDDGETRAFVKALISARAVHLAGGGRSGLVMRSFAMRLTELGFRTHVAGESSAPACGPGDLLVVCSGSGRSPALLVAAEQALHTGARLGLVTAAVLAPLTRLAHVKVLLPPMLPAPDPARSESASGVPDEARLVSGLRTLFEQAAFLYLDALVPLLLTATGQSLADLEARRPTIEG